MSIHKTDIFYDEFRYFVYIGDIKMNNLDYEIELFDDLSYPVTTSNPFEMNSAGYMVLPHIHSRMELMKVINGPVYVTVGVERYICNKGDIIFVPSNTLHEVTAAEQGKLLNGLIFEYEPFNFNFTNYINNKKI